MAVDNIIARFELQTAQAQAALAELNKRLDAAEKELKELQKEAKKTEGVFSGLKSQLVSLGATLGVVFSAQQIVSFTKDAIQAAADMGETIGKVGEIFKEEASYIEQWANTAATTMGQTKQQALDAAANFAIFGKGAGLTGKVLADFAVDLTELASDLSSFNNTSPEQAINALGAALRGESEPIRAYGVLLDDMTLRQEAVKMGLIETTKQALTPQQRVLAAHAAILKQTTTAQGDFARTADSLSNKQKILSAEFTDLQVKIGEKLAPAFEKLVDGALELVRNLDADTVIAFAKAVGVAGGAFAAWKIGQQVQQVGSFTGAISRATGGIKAMGKAVAANPLGALLAAMTAIVAIGTPVVKNMLGISDALDSIEDSANQAAKSLRAEQIEMNNMLDALKKTNPETAERKRLIDEINSRYGLTLQNQGSEIANLQMLEAAQRELNAQYEEKIALRIKEAKMEAAIQKQAELELQLQEQLSSGWEKFYTATTSAFGALGGPLGLIGENTGIRQTQKELERVKELISSLSAEGFGEGVLAGLLTPDAPAAVVAEQTISDAARKAAEERVKALEQAEAEIRKINAELLSEALSQQERERLAVELKYKDQLAEARKFANDSTAEGRRWAAVEASLQEAVNMELLAIDDKYREMRRLREEAFRQEQLAAEHEANKKKQADRIAFLESLEEDYVVAYDKAAAALMELVNRSVITWEEYYREIGKLDQQYRDAAKAREDAANQAAEQAIQDRQARLLQTTQLFGETLTNIMQITAGNSKAFADFQKFVGLAELAVSKAVAIANAIRVISSSSVTAIDLIANIAAVTAAITSVFAGIFSVINQSQTPEVPEFESYATGTAYLERNGAPKGIDTIPIMANEGEAIIPTEANAAAPGLAKAWIDGNLDDYIFRNYVIPALEEQAAEAAAKRMEAMSLSQAHVAGFDDFRLYVQSKKQVSYLEQIAANTKRERQSRKRFYS